MSLQISNKKGPSEKPENKKEHYGSKLYCYEHLRNVDWIEKSMGTLGGGNHFIEVDADEEGNKYLVIHTGSRNLGKQVAEYYQSVAVDNLQGKAKLEEAVTALIEEYKSAGRNKEIQSGIEELKRKYNPDLRVPKDLCWLDGEWREKYLNDMKLCQVFAVGNRTYIANAIMMPMEWWIENPSAYFESIHNYIDHESNIVRKGAISAKYGERLIIPINMRDGCIIGVGKGNPDWNFSAPHGAGRIMSRMQARQSLRLKEYQETMSGIYTTSVCDETIDEAPQAYKSMQEIVDCIGDTVEIKRIIKPLYNFKAAE